MKKLFLSVLAFGLVLSSCKKEEPTPTTPTATPTPEPTTPTNGWKLGTTSYTTVYVGRSGSNSLSAVDAIPGGSNPAVNSCNVFFSEYPTTGGTFTVVQYPSANTLTANQIGVSAGIYSTSQTYTSTGSDNIEASVTVATDGKISVVIPEIWVKNTSSSDSLKLTGTISE